MLEMIHGSREAMEKYRPPLTEKEIISIKDAAFPAPFQPGLEYNSPAHGTWNIVHTGMLLPGSHQIYVCADNCNRGVVLTAAEMGAADRFSTIAVEEDDITNGQMEELVIEGVSEILHKLKQKPMAVLLFTVCIHHFMGCDIPYIYRTLRERFPDQWFIEAYMDPIMQKGGLTPDQKLRRAMYDCLEKKERNPKQVNIIGNDLALQPDCEMLGLLRARGYTVKDLTTCESFEEYLSMAESCLNIVTYPPAKVAGEALSKRLDMEFLYLPQTFDYDEIDRQLALLQEKLSGTPETKPSGPAEPSDAKMCGEQVPLAANYSADISTAPLRERCEAELERARALLDGMPVAIDAAAVPRVLGLARLLLSHGFRVIRVYADSFSAEEQADFVWLQEHAPDLTVCATIHHNMRVFPREGEPVLAIGQKAAYFHQTGHFVNMVEGGGLYGYAGILGMCERIREAFLTQKDTKDLVIRKGLGCVSCI